MTATSTSINNDSILSSVKKLLGLEDGYEVFDVDIIMHINTVFSILVQMGIGKTSAGFAIENKDNKWIEFIGEDTILIQMVKSYMYQRVKLMFDPPASNVLIDALKENIKELEGRLYIQYATSYPETPEVIPEE